MKSFTNYINEGIELPKFIHPELNNPNDPDGKFWTMIGNTNIKSDKTSKRTYLKIGKMANDLYTELSMFTPDDQITAAMDLISQATNHINKSSEDAPDEMSAQDVKWLRNVLFIVQGVDSRLSKYRWYKNCHIDVKAGYVPLKGSNKNPKIKYRILVKLPEPATDRVYKGVNKDITNMSPLHRNYVAGIEWNKEHTKFSILITNTEGYKING